MIFKGETLNRKREVWFALADITNPQNAIAGFNWSAAAAGVLKLRTPGGSLGNADLTRVVEIGDGDYVYQLGDGDVTLAGSGILVVDASIAVAVPNSWGFEVVDPADFAAAGGGGGGGGGGGTALPIGPVTLTGLLDIVRTRGDYLSSLTFTDAYLTHEIQAAWAELYELIAETHEGWWDKDGTIATVAAQNFIGLPVDCWRVQGVDILVGSEYWPMRQLGLKDRNKYGASAGQPIGYRLSVRGLELFPTPNKVYTLRVSYTPIVTTLDDTGIQLFGWEEYIITGALLRLDQREERPTQEREAELGRCKARVIEAASKRRSAEPEYLNRHEDREGGMGWGYGGEY